MGDFDAGNKWREEGNDLHKAGDFQRAACCYGNALLDLPRDVPQFSACLKNRAACLLKLKQFNNVVGDCTRALAILVDDEKSLFRRCQAYVALEQPREALGDALRLARAHPKNKAVRPIIKTLAPVVKAQIRAEKEPKTWKYLSTACMAAGLAFLGFGVIKSFL